MAPQPDGSAEITPIVARRPEPWPAALVPLAVRAAVRLVLARIDHERFRTSDVGERNRAAAERGRVANDTAHDRLTIERVAWTLPRIARRMPFRSDCLVQAMAAQDWLLEEGLASTIVIGIDKQAGEELASHAWLLCRELVVVGGETGRYSAIL